MRLASSYAPGSPPPIEIPSAARHTGGMKSRVRPARNAERGFLLIEASMTTYLIAASLTALITVFFLTLRANSRSESTAVATHLSLRLMEEIRLRKWDEQTPTPANYTRRRSAIGTDSGESAADKTTFDDIDDFNGWTEKVPLDPMMRTIQGFSSYSSSVTVRYVNTTTLAPTGGTTDFKLVSVCTWSRGRKSICLDTIITNH